MSLKALQEAANATVAELAADSAAYETLHALVSDPRRLEEALNARQLTTVLILGDRHIDLGLNDAARHAAVKEALTSLGQRIVEGWTALNKIASQAVAQCTAPAA